MPKFRKRPIIIEAEQFDPGIHPPQKGVCRNQCPPLFTVLPHLHTAHKNQLVILEAGDWILMEPDGIHFYPCKPDIFAVTYEPVHA